MKQNKILAIFFSIIIVLITTILYVFPVFQTFYLSFKSYNISSGILNSPWVGFENYIRFLSHPSFTSLIINTIFINALSYLLPCILGVALGLFATKAKNSIIISLFLLPVFIPQTVYVAFIILIGGAYITSNGIITALLYALVTGIHTLFLTAFVTAFLGYSLKNTSIGNIKGGLIGGFTMLVIGLTNFLTGDIASIIMIQNPLNINFTEVLSTYIYDIGMRNMDFSHSSAVFTIKTIIQLPIAIIFGIILATTITKINKTKIHTNNIATNNSSYLIAGISIIVTLIVTSLLFFINTNSQNSTSILTENFSTYILNSIVYSIIPTILFFIFTFVATYSFANLNAYLCVMFPLFILVLNDNLIVNYLNAGSLGVLNTILPATFSNVINAPLILILSVILILTKPSFKNMLPILILFTAINFSICWGDFVPSITYNPSPNSQSLSSIMYQFAMMPNNNIHSVMAIQLIVPLVVGICAIVIYGLFDKKTKIKEI